MGTWIEISALGLSKIFTRCRSLRGNVDRNCCAACNYLLHPVVPYVGTWIEMTVDPIAEYGGLCRSLRGNVDRNIDFFCISTAANSRSLRGNVDRNTNSLSWFSIMLVVPYVGTWIEIVSKYHDYFTSALSFPTWERG